MECCFNAAIERDVRAEEVRQGLQYDAEEKKRRKAALKIMFQGRFIREMGGLRLFYPDRKVRAGAGENWSRNRSRSR